jgi:phosphohistidine phosphatase
MKTLILVRHAKSDWGHEGLEDIDRPLNERGYRDAEIMRKYLFAKYTYIDHFVSSPAVRAFTTATIFARKYERDVRQIELDPSLYHSPIQNYLAKINSLDDQHNSVILFGHNPGITEIASHISDYEFENIATCGIVSVQFDIKSWTEVDDHAGQLEFYEFASNI